MTDCTAQQYLFQGSGRREVVAAFNGGTITSDAGVVLIRQVDECRRLVERFAACFQDFRHPGQVEHTVEELLRQRIYGLVLGYEDLNDHEDLRRDPLLATMVGKSDPLGQSRRQAQDRGKALAGKSTLNRLEWGCSDEAEDDRYRRIAVDPEAVDRFFVDRFLDSFAQRPRQIILDVDATDDPLHGSQEGRFFHGYYGCYCYLPLYIFAGSHLLCARLRRSNIDASAGTTQELSRIVAQIRERWAKVQILVRGDSGFAREELMAWCEANGVDFVLGLARNPRLEEALSETFDEAHEICERTGEPTRCYGEWQHSTLDSWSRERRVIGKAEITERGENPRFVVTSLPARRYAARRVYEQIYCARGDMENRIKEQQLDLFATRTSGRLMRVNQVRLWLSSVAYMLLNELRRLGLAGTRWAGARPVTLRNKLLKIGARVRITVRKVWVSMATGYPHERLFAHVYGQLQRAGPLPA
ncbi:MAG: IS1380 family transposase [Acidobacteriota bacterium]|nr:IS1380 family transposase [Acidobacteriota bacterium]